MNDKTLDLARSICEEFCQNVLIDPENGSILMYIPKKYYGPITSRLVQLEFVEVFKQKRRKYIVSLMQLLVDGMEDLEISLEDEEDDDDGVDLF